MLRWATAGAVLGGAVALVAFAPAAWLAAVVSDATDERVVLGDARGTIWQGSAVVVLTGGAGSRSASALPGRLQWTLGLAGTALALGVRHDCCINGELRLRIAPSPGRLRVELLPGADVARPLGQWPASWLVGLGTPWNTLQPSGSLQLTSPGLVVEQVQGRWLFSGQAQLEMGGIASRMSSLDVLGSYRLLLIGDAASGSGPQVQLNTINGALRLSGSGQWSGLGAASKLHFNGLASAAPGSEAALGGLLNIIGRRQDASSVISIG